MFMILSFYPFLHPVHCPPEVLPIWITETFSCPLVSGWVWPIGSLGKNSEVCEWDQGIYFTVRVPWAVFITLTDLTALSKAVFPTWISLLWYLPPLLPFVVSNPGLQIHPLWFPSLCQHFMNSHFVIKISLTYRNLNVLSVSCWEPN